MKASANIFPLVEFAEGAAPATPATGQVRIYAKADGLMYSKDDAGAESPLGGGGMTNPMTTAGDIIFGGVAGAPTRLAIGTTNYVLKVIAGVPAWQPEAGGIALNTVNEFTATQYVAPVALTDGANIAVDADLSNNFTVTLGGNRTLDNPTNLEPGMVLNFQITQDGTGSRTLAYGSAYNWPSGTAPTLSTAAGAVDVISAISFDGTSLQCVAQLAFS